MGNQELTELTRVVVHFVMKIVLYQKGSPKDTWSHPKLSKVF